MDVGSPSLSGVRKIRFYCSPTWRPLPRVWWVPTGPLVKLPIHTAGFHFPTIEQGGNSLYPAMAQRASSVEVLRILISIGPTETMHFQTWADKAGNAPPLTAKDPVTGVSVTFPDLNSTPFGGETFQTNLISFLESPLPCFGSDLPASL